VAFGLDWWAEAEYGGYHQALATGIYVRHGLEVSIRHRRDGAGACGMGAAVQAKRRALLLPPPPGEGWGEQLS